MVWLIFKIFDNLYANMVKVEKLVVSEISFGPIGSISGKKYQDYKKVKSAMIYPSVIMFCRCWYCYS